MEGGEDCQGGVGHVQRLQLLLQAGKEGGGDHLDGVVSQGEVKEGGGGGEGSVINLVDVVVTQI